MILVSMFAIVWIFLAQDAILNAPVAVVINGKCVILETTRFVGLNFLPVFSGQVCRVNRKFIYESLLFDGKDTEITSPLTGRR